MWFPPQKSHQIPYHNSKLPLPGSRPDVLQVPITLGETVERVVALAAGPDESAQRIRLVLTSVATVLVDFADGDLDRRVVVGFDDTVGGVALAGHVALFFFLLAGVIYLYIHTWGILVYWDD